MFRSHTGAVVVATTFVLCSCGTYDKDISISDVRNAQVIVLRAAPGVSGVHSLSVRCHGNLDDAAMFTLMLDEKPYKSEKVQGTFSFTWGGDWYAPVARIEYRPDHVRSGDITIEYHFSSL